MGPCTKASNSKVKNKNLCSLGKCMCGHVSNSGERNKCDSESYIQMETKDFD